jgi:tetratricopeptide (TPR) repeat protein
MSFRTSYLIGGLICCLSFSWAAPTTDLTGTLQTAREFLATHNTDNATANTLATELLRGVETYPHSSLVPEALSAAARLQKVAGNTVLAAATAKRLLLDYPESEFTPQTYELAWTCLTDNGKNPLLGADLTLTLAQKLGRTIGALTYYQKAFEIYRDAGHWNEALATGKQYLQNTTTPEQNAPMMLTLADVSLKNGDTGYAEENLRTFLLRYPTLPQVVTARTLLGAISAAQGNEADAKENYSLAWTTFQKNRQKPEYSQHDVMESAAEALWQIQTRNRREFEETTAFGAPFKEKQVRRQVEELTKGYEQVMLTDAEFAARSLNATGDVCSRFADLLLQDGYRTCNSKGFATDQSPYTDAMPEYTRAISAYSRAAEQARGHSESRENGRAERYATNRTFELTSGQGDVLFAWALDLQRTTVTNDLSSKTSADRVALLTDCVTPVLNQALTYKQQSLEFADRVGLKNEAEESRATLDIAMRPILDEMKILCRSDWNALKSSATGLAAAYTRSNKPETAKTLTESVINQYALAKEDAEHGLAAATELYTALQKCRPTTETRQYWNEAMLSFYGDYASLCETMQTYLEVCVTSLARSNDDEARDLRTKFSKLQTSCSSEEYSTLVRCYDLSTQFSITSPLGDRMLARLAALDPKQYGTLNELNSASRKKP